MLASTALALQEYPRWLVCRSSCINSGAMLCISVSLPSGQTAVVSLHKESMVSELKMAAQRELKKRFLRPGDEMVWRVSWVSQRVPPQMPPPLPKK